MFFARSATSSESASHSMRLPVKPPAASHAPSVSVDASWSTECCRARLARSTQIRLFSAGFTSTASSMYEWVETSSLLAKLRTPTRARNARLADDLRSPKSAPPNHRSPQHADAIALALRHDHRRQGALRSSLEPRFAFSLPASVCSSQAWFLRGFRFVERDRLTNELS